MLAIQKTDKPGIFDSWVRQPDNNKEDLKKHILEKEQQHLCCYCEKSISADLDKSHLEHVRPQSRFPEFIYDYNNLVVSCQTKDRCGHFKGDKFSDLFIIPTEENPDDYLTYSANGEIRPKNNNEKGREAIDILNLNSYKLVQARKTVFKQLQPMIDQDKIYEIASYFNEYPSFVKYVIDNYTGLKFY